MCSVRNKSKEGFKYFQISINDNGVSRGAAEDCEHALAALIRGVISDKKQDEITVSNANRINGKIRTGDNEKIESKNSDVDSVDHEIEKRLQEEKSLKAKDNEYKITCLEIGSLEKNEHKYCNNTFREVASVEFPYVKKAKISK